MIRIQNGFAFQDLYCYPNKEQPQSYYYLPSKLQPQRDSTGKPMFSVVTVGSGGFLQLSLNWDATQETLEALRQEIARKDGIDNPATIRLAFAPVTVQGVFLMLGDGNGNFTDLKKNTSSGFPPYSALFSLQLDASQQAQAMAALNGRPGFLSVRYEASLPTFIEVTGKLTGNVTDVVTKLKNATPSTLVEVQKLIQQAILEGSVQLTVETVDNTPESLVTRTSELVLQQAAELLQRFVRGEANIPDIARVEVTASLKEPRVIPLQLQTDIATWFGSMDGSDHLHIAPGTSPMPCELPASTGQPVGTGGPPSELLRVRLGFAAGEAPLALVRLRRGGVQALLSPPDFIPVELPKGAPNGPVILEASYTTGGPAYQTNLTVPATGDMELAPGDLGMVQVTVDARSLVEAEAKKARILLRYWPEGSGVADERTVHFRNLEWQASWFFITRNRALNGILEYEWQVTTADGELIKYEMVETTSPQIVLSLGNKGA